MSGKLKLKERPMIFSGEMVRAILEGIKYQTRRTRGLEMINVDPHAWEFLGVDPYGENAGKWIFSKNGGGAENCIHIKCPWEVGSRLWVREKYKSDPSESDIVYLANGETERFLPGVDSNNADLFFQKYKHPKTFPPIHMYRWMSRILLEITDIRVERVRDISEEDAIAEGVHRNLDFPIENGNCPKCFGEGLHGAFGEGYGVIEVECQECDTCVKRFKNLWNSINEKKGFGWDFNPWVWPITFKVLESSITNGERHEKIWSASK